jgi:hypothetical protein
MAEQEIIWPFYIALNVETHYRVPKGARVLSATFGRMGPRLHVAHTANAAGVMAHDLLILAFLDHIPHDAPGGDFKFISSIVAPMGVVYHVYAAVNYG